MLTKEQVKRMYSLGLLWSKETSFDFELETREMYIVADKCRMFILQKIMRECGFKGKLPAMAYDVNWFLGHEDIFFFVDFGDFDATAEQFEEVLETGEQHFRLWNGWGGDECVDNMAFIQDKLAEASAKFMGAKDLFLGSMEDGDCKNTKELGVLKHAAELIAGAGNYDVSINSQGGMFVPLPKGYELPFVPDNPGQNPHKSSVLTYTPDGVRFMYSLGENSSYDSEVCMSLITDVVRREEWHVTYSALTELWCVYALAKGGQIDEGAD